MDVNTTRSNKRLSLVLLEYSTRTLVLLEYSYSSTVPPFSSFTTRTLLVVLYLCAFDYDTAILIVRVVQSKMHNNIMLTSSNTLQFCIVLK
jgi:hypothetical protein